MTDAISKQKENKMGVMPINKLLISMSLPMMISMLVQALYNIVDSVFVAKISEDALTAVGLAFPFQNLMIAVGMGTGVGVNAILSRSLGEKNTENANKAANNSILLIILNFVVFALVGGFFSRIFFEVQTDIPVIIEYGQQYLFVCSVFSIGLFSQFAFERLLQSTGKTFYAMITQATGAIINIILDPILIFGWLGIPAMGVTGAAVATVIGQCIAAILAAILNLKVNNEIHLSFRQMKPDGEIIKKIYIIGVPSILMASIGSVMTFFLNKILMAFVSTATAVLGVYFKLQSFVFMPVFGLNVGMVPIIAYNYGAKKRERIYKTIKLSAIYAVSIMLVGFAVFQLIPDKLLLLFEASPDMMEIGTAALRTISISFLFAGFCIVVGSVFQALGRSIYSLMVSIARQIIVLLPAAYLLSLTGKLSAVWWAFPIAELASVTVSVFFLLRVLKKLRID